jgi:hypothetical protein
LSKYDKKIENFLEFLSNSLVQKCMKNLPVHPYVTTSMLVLDVVEGPRLSTFHDVVIRPSPRAGQQGPFLGRLY